jgi:hypothetical protein
MTDTPDNLFTAWTSAQHQLDTDQSGNAIVQALAASAALQRTILANQWPLVYAAIKRGVPASTLAEALDIQVDELRAGFKGWCRAQRHIMRVTGRDGITAAEETEAMALMEQAAAK